MEVFVDGNVSGAVPPGERPALSRLCERLDQFDVLLVWRADRLARSLTHFSEIVQLCDGGGVRLVAVEDGWDVSTPHGRFAANVLASFAEFERELNRERVVSAQNHMRRLGRWTGGRVPYGLRPAPNQQGAGKVLVRDERAEPVIRELADRLLAGDSPTRVAADLQARGVPAPRVHNSTKPEPAPAAWSHKSIKIVMTSPTLLGRRIEHRTGKVICRDGAPLQFWSPLLTEAEYDAVAQLFESGYRPRRPNRPSHWLYGIVVCGLCGKNMKRSESSGAETLRCLGALAAPHKSVSIRADAVEEWLEAEIAERLTDAPVVEHLYRAKRDHGEEIARLRRYLTDLMEDRRAGVFSTPDAEAVYRSEYRSASERLAAYEAEPSVPGSWYMQPAGEHMRDVWPRWTPDQQGSYLLGCGVRVLVDPPPRPRMRVPAGERCACDLGDLAPFDARRAA